jgi:histidine phosphotransfer protein HptB
MFDPEGARRMLGLAASDFARVFECIWSEVSERRSLLEEAFSAGDLARVALHAHTIKSCAATIGAKHLSLAAAAVEKAADAGHVEALAAAITAFQAAKETLSKLLGMG